MKSKIKFLPLFALCANKPAIIIDWSKNLGCPPKEWSDLFPHILTYLDFRSPEHSKTIRKALNERHPGLVYFYFHPKSETVLRDDIQCGLIKLFSVLPARFKFIPKFTRIIGYKIDREEFLNDIKFIKEKFIPLQKRIPLSARPKNFSKDKSLIGRISNEFISK